MREMQVKTKERNKIKKGTKESFCNEDEGRTVVPIGQESTMVLVGQESTKLHWVPK